MATYSTKEHSTLLKTFDQKMEEMEQDQTKELLFNILLPVKKMNNDIYNLTSEYPEFVENKESSIFLSQLNAFNENIMKILNNEAIIVADNNTSSSSSSSSPSQESSASKDEDQTNAAVNMVNIELALHELIDILVLTDIRPINYDKDLLVSLLINNDITNQNVLQHKNKMLSILEDCQFPKDRARFTMEQIERNLSQTQDKKKDNDKDTDVAIVGPLNKAEAEAEADEEDEDSMGVKVVDLTMMSIETLFDHVFVNRREIHKLYKQNDIDTHKLSSITEMEFASILMKCGDHDSNRFSKQQCIKIHRAIKSLLNIEQSFRFDIDIGEAVIYLVNEDNAFFTQKDVIIEAGKITDAFKEYSAQDIHRMGKKQFIKILQTETQIKMGHGTKLWNSIKAFIEDSNLKVPPQILITDRNQATASAIEKV